MKKVLIVNKMYSPDIGGVETVVKQYAEYLNKFYDLTVLTASAHQRIKTNIEYINGVKVIRCPSWGIYFSMPLSITLLLKLIFNRRKYDLIHFHEPYPIGSFMGLLPKRCNYIVTWHSDIIKQKSLKGIIEYFQKKLCSKADLILSTSPNLTDFSNVLKDFKQKVRTLPLSINLYDYDSSLPKSEEEFLLYIGRLSYYKGINILLDAYQRSNSQFPLYIVGDGEQNIKDEINHFVKASDKKIVFINKYVSEKEKRFYLKNCRYLLFPSIFPSEAFGIVQLEAMVYSKPIINTDLPTGVPWVSLDKKTGITTAVGDIEELSEAINTLSSDDLVRLYGKNARERVEIKFSDEVVLKKLKGIYDKILE